MALYIVTGNYTAAAIKGMMANPSDREAAVRPLIEAAGGKVKSYHITTGDNDFMMMVESPDGDAMLAPLIVAGSSGMVSNLKTVQALTSAEFVAAQKKAGKIAGGYKAPGA